MDNEQINTAGRLRGLLAVAASSVITAILANVDRPLGSPLLWVALLFWTLLGGATGVWVLRGKAWRMLTRNMRLRLAIGCFAISWGSLAAMALPMARTMPGAYVLGPGQALFIWLVVATGFALALIFVASFVASFITDHQRKQDEGDIFP
ncbi:MAG TPA: hypothetical protein VFL17_05025 [Anaerolineae bacterium]|nr:hypothetical protein [Anaerolineae bacterium]